jgi:hypothetical protein
LAFEVSNDFNGCWSGETSQQHPIIFSVSNNNVMNFNYTVYSPGIVTMTTEISGSPFLAKIDYNNEFSISSNYSYGSSWNLQNGQVTFDGKFNNDQECIGTLEIHDPSGVISGTREAGLF